MTEQPKGRDEEKKSGKIKDKFTPKSPMGKRPFNYYWIYAIIAVLLISTQLVNFDPPTEEITLHEFEKMVKDDDVSKLDVFNQQYAEVTLTKDALAKEEYSGLKSTSILTGNPANGPHFRFEIGPEDSFTRKLDEYGATYGFYSYEYRTVENWGNKLGWIIPIGVMIVIWIFIMRRMGAGGGPGGQIFNIGKSKATLFDRDTSVKVTFDDVAGLEGAKEEIQEIVDFLKNPTRYTQLGAHIPKGALLVGPPGTGKTLLAKAVAGEAQVPFFSLSGSDFVEMFVGVGASRVRDLFKQAKEKSPSIIFIDEIDAIGRARGKSPAQGANDERENTLNQLLTEMDGFGTNSGVIILGATNRADILDRALLRPGRFDRQIHVDMPDLVERKEIFKVHLKPIKLSDTVDIDFLAKQTPGFSGADIANLCNEAALIAARKNKKQVDKQDFLDAVDRIIGGLEKKSKIITPAEKKVIAYHEAGHATSSWLLEHASPLVKVTIVPRGKSLGAAWYLPDERQITTPDQMLDEMCAALGGRAAEEIIFGEISTGALSDLEKVTKQAYAMVSVYGLNKKIGNISFYDSTGQSEYSFSKPYSERTAQTIDEEVGKYIEAAYQRAIDLLSKNKDKLVKLADVLLEKEVIFKEDLEKVFGARPFAESTRADVLQETNDAENKAAQKETSSEETAVDPALADVVPAAEETPSKDSTTETS